MLAAAVVRVVQRQQSSLLQWDQQSARAVVLKAGDSICSFSIK
jgi:hypothetical protein